MRNLSLILAPAVVLVWATAAHAYMEVAYTLGRVVSESNNIVHIRVEAVDKTKNTIVYKKIRDLKGTHPGETIKHNIAKAGFNPREWQTVMAWAEVGQQAVFFYNGQAGEVCIKNYWYQVYPGDWWNMSHAEPYLLRTFCGPPEKLAAAVASVLAGQEVVIPAMVDGDKNAIQLRTAKVQRLKASMKLMDYNAKRDFVGWGGEDYRPITDMPGFAQVAGLSRTDPGACGIAPADFDADGRTDVLLFGVARVALLQNSGGTFAELPLPLDTGARGAAWADFDADGKLDLVLATPTGPRLLLNGGSAFKDATPALPKLPYYNLTAVAALDYDGDKLVDVVAADGFSGLRLWKNVTNKPGDPKFLDVSDAAGLGENGVGGQLKGDDLQVADVNGDGRPDLLYSAGRGVLALNTGKGFEAAKESGIAFDPGGVRPAFADFDADGRVDLFVPQPGQSKLFRNDGGGKFVDVTAQHPALASVRHATSAAWADVSGNGKLDLLVGCAKGPNRFFANTGSTLADATETLGLQRRTYNSRALCVIDVNKDGVPDLVLNNEHQEPVALIGRAK